MGLPHQGHGGTTSACAENTRMMFGVSDPWRNYLRVRGEYSRRPLSKPVKIELPPRARRIPTLYLGTRNIPGTTSACAENTGCRMRCITRIRNYLRVRGEYLREIPPYPIDGELPPRARRIHSKHDANLIPVGTTSACAENTHHLDRKTSTHRNYLRVRGEYFSKTRPPQQSKELPPRARRIPPVVRSGHGDRGTTSACAENTPSRNLSNNPLRNYLRVRGEYHDFTLRAQRVKELPPRARRIRGCVAPFFRTQGTTSACAENTRLRLFRLVTLRNYLRVRGEYLRGNIKSWFVSELPPRARRIPKN